MTSDIGTISPQVGGISTPVVAAPVASTTPALTPTVATTPSVLIHNPRIVQDPRAGLITEYFDNNGNQIVSQAPSAAAVAYLRLGLSADGTVKVSQIASVTA